MREEGDTKPGQTRKDRAREESAGIRRLDEPVAQKSLVTNKCAFVSRARGSPWGKPQEHPNYNGNAPPPPPTPRTRQNPKKTRGRRCGVSPRIYPWTPPGHRPGKFSKARPAVAMKGRPPRRTRRWGGEDAPEIPDIVLNHDVGP